LKPRVIRKQIQGFLIAGGLATGFHWSVMSLLIVGGFSPVIATGVGAGSGAALNYALQRGLAFGSSLSHKLAIRRYAVATIAAWLFNLIIFALLNSVLGLPVVIAQFITTATVAALNFFIYKRFVFNE